MRTKNTNIQTVSKGKKLIQQPVACNMGKSALLGLAEVGTALNEEGDATGKGKFWDRRTERPSCGQQLIPVKTPSEFLRTSTCQIPIVMKVDILGQPLSTPGAIPTFYSQLATQKDEDCPGHGWYWTSLGLTFSKAALSCLVYITVGKVGQQAHLKSW